MNIAAMQSRKLTTNIYHCEPRTHTCLFQFTRPIVSPSKVLASSPFER